MLFFGKILIIFLCCAGLVNCATIRKGAAYKAYKDANLAIFDGHLTDVQQPWKQDYANPDGDGFKALQTTYQKSITTALTAKNESLYKDAQITVNQFSGIWITESQTGTVVNFILGLSPSNPPSDVQLDNDLERGSVLAGFQWTGIDVQNADLPPLPPAGTSDGWKQAAQMYLSSINISVDPCQDFFRYTCDNYIAKHPIGQASIQNTMNTLQDVVNSNLTKAFESLATKSQGENSRTMKTTNQIYQACKSMNKSTDLLVKMTRTYGGWPIMDDKWNYCYVPTDVFWMIGDMFTRYGVPTLFTPSVDIDGKNISRHIMYLDQASLAIPTPYYQSPELAQTYQDALRQTIYQTVAVLLADDGRQVDNATVLPQIDRMVEIEYRLAMISINGSDERNESAGYNTYTVSQAQSQFPDFQWASYVDGLLHDIYPGVDPSSLLDPFVIEEPHRYVRDMNRFVREVDEDSDKMRDLINYLVFRLINPYMPFAGNPELARIHREFKKALDKVPHPSKHVKPQTTYKDSSDDDPTSPEMQCAQYVINNLPYAAGRLYIDYYFPSDDRDDIAVMINNILSAFSSTLSGLQWMDNASALRAFQKVTGLVRNVAYPDWQEDDTRLDTYHKSLIDAIAKIDPQDPQRFFKFNAEVIAFVQRVTFQKLQLPGDRTEFGTSSAVVDAWYQPIRNSITIPAAILNPPFYRYDFPQATKYGGLGIVMGHELSHAFDDQGVQFDWNGTLNTWMTPQASAGFSQMAECVVDEYDKFCFPIRGDTYCVNGITTQGENIGDNGGLKASYHAYEAYVNAHGEEPRLPGMEAYTMEQIFFIAYGQLWCGSYSDDALLNLLLTNPHSPGVDRINGAVQNFPKFAEAFGCKKGDPMYPVNACDIW